MKFIQHFAIGSYQLYYQIKILLPIAVHYTQTVPQINMQLIINTNGKFGQILIEEGFEVLVIEKALLLRPQNTIINISGRSFFFRKDVISFRENYSNLGCFQKEILNRQLTK